MKITLGITKHGTVKMDIDVLLSTRLLLTADSGGGKTWLLKRICEQMAEKVPIIIIDPEGEFSPLREKFNFVLVGPGGETPADPRSAGLVAQTLLKLKASAILDIYEMPESKRHEFVKLFCDGLINSPKSLWHPTVVIVDEAHMFCPEKGTGESLASDSVKSLATRGRKRGICPIFATQRLAEFNKGASSMCLNRLVGGTFEDVNLTRALQVLSVPNDHKAAFLAEIKLLEPGYFYALGRAICKERTLFKVGEITTAHGSAALKYAETPPPPPAEIARLLPKLADLPKAAEEKAQTEKELRAEIRSLKAELRAGPKPPLLRLQPDNSAAVARAVHSALTKYGQTVARDIAQRNTAINKLVRLVMQIETLCDHSTLGAIGKIADVPAPAFPTKVPDAEIPLKEKPSGIESRPERGTSITRTHQHPENNGDLAAPVMRIIKALAEFEAIGKNVVQRTAIASSLRVKADTGSFKNYLSQLRTRGYITDVAPSSIALTDAGRAVAPMVSRPVDTKELLERSASVFGGTPAKMLRIIHERFPSPVSRAEIAELLGVSPETGSFKNYISQLRTAGLIQDAPDRSLVASEWMFVD